MSIFSDQNTRLLQGLKDAKLAVEEKKGVVPVTGTSPKIEDIVQGITSIPSGGGGVVVDYYALLEDALASVGDSHPYKFAQTVSNAHDTFVNTSSNGNAGMQWWTSDGGYYTGSNVTHTWNKALDVDHGNGMCERWVVCSRTNENGFVHCMNDATYVVIHDGSMSYNSCFKTKPLLLGIKSITGKRTFSSAINNINFSAINGSNRILDLQGFDFTGITTFGTGLQVATLMNISNVSNITTSLILNSAVLTRASMLDIFNGLVPATQTLTLGALNLARLSGEDLLIATSKGWTVN